ncbi:SWIM zinc finger family protein [Pelistega ratti]|uniref:SWIM zinc finger family protein n=1 Tax=Pelistega ratti TaxID=2652177 RepID=UPI0013595644|nr:SWIM zinc finger family protein [Pelistega ratti]
MCFEKVAEVVGEKIAERGWDYFIQNKVRDLEERASYWTAQIMGSQIYHAVIKLSKTGVLLDAQCNCPYNHAYCKHIAALWFAVLDREQKIDKSSLGISSHVDKQTQDTSNIFSAAFSPSPIAYQDLIDDVKKICNKARNGCSYYQASAFASSIQQIINQRHLFSLEEQFELLQLIYKRLITIIEKSDDSDGLIGDAIITCLNESEVIYEEADEVLQKKIEKFWKTLAENPDKHWIAETEGIADIWLDAMLNKKVPPQKLLKWIDDQQTTVSSYQQDKWHQRTLRLLYMINQEQAIAFLEQHLEIPEFLSRYTTLLMNRGDYKEAEALLLNAVKKGGSGKLRGEWLYQLIELSERQKDTEKIAHYAKLLTFAGFGLNVSAFERWKECYQPSEWVEVRNQTIKKLKGATILIAQIYQHERLWDDLAKLLRISNDVSLIKQFLNVLPKEYHIEIARHLFKLKMKEFKTIQTGRTAYQRWCYDIRELKQAYPALQHEIKAALSALREQYQNRPAFIEELDRILLNLAWYREELP